MPAAVRDQIHSGERAQLDLQHAHGHDAEPFGLVIHGTGRALVGVEDLQGLQPLHVVEEGGAHIRVGAPVFLEHAGGAHRDHADDEHDQRRADEQRHGRRHVDRRDDGEQGDRRENRIEQLRQEQLEEGLDLFDALARGLHHVGGGDAGAVRGPERKHLAVEPFAQAEFDAFGRFGAESGRGADRQVPHQRADDEYAGVQGRARRGDHGFGAAEQPGQQCHQRDHESDIGQQRHPQQGDLAGDQPPDAGRHRKQSLIEHSNPYCMRASSARLAFLVCVPCG